MSQTHLNLPYPPSVNGLFDNRRGGRKKTDKYKAWIADATEMLLRQRFNRHKGKVAVNIFLTKPDNRKRDIDNTSKGLLDLLVTHRVIEDDSLIQVLHTAWATAAEPGAYVIVEDI